MDDVKGTKGSGRKSYSAEFKAEAVRLVTSGERSQSEVSRSLGIGSSTINKWYHELIGKGGRPVNTAELAELRQLRQEVN